jgi:hypothetical protein
MCNQLQGRMFHPTIDLLLQISTTNHPQVGATNPQERVSLHCPLTAQHNPQQANFPTTIPIHQLSSPQPTQPKEWDPPSLHTVPQALPTSLQGSNIGWLGISLAGDSRDVNCNRKISQQQAHYCRVISHT